MKARLNLRRHALIVAFIAFVLSTTTFYSNRQYQGVWFGIANFHSGIYHNAYSRSYEFAGWIVVTKDGGKHFETIFGIGFPDGS